MNTGPVGVAWFRAPMDALAEPSKLELCGGSVSKCAAVLELLSGLPQLGDGALGFPSLRQRPAREGARQRGVHGHSDLIGGNGGGKRVLGGHLGSSSCQRDSREGAVCH